MVIEEISSESSGPSTARLLTREDILELVRAVVDELKPMLEGMETPGKRRLRVMVCLTRCRLNTQLNL